MSTWAVTHRPSRFEDVLGQRHVADLLRTMSARFHAADEGSVWAWPPALVFYGPRGTGKTSTARIVSAALNCLTPVNGDPCGTCVSCESITNGTSPGVTELDMASNGSVEDVRDIRARAAFGMSAERYRVWLLDEVHSASREAFNALLKLLEEPPPNLLFILVTTEPERIPDTIRSRSMEFEFRRLSLEVLIDRLKHVATVEGVADRVDEDVYRLLASRARGGMRDAVMSLEQVCFREGPVTADTVRATFGVSTLPERLLDAAVKGDSARGFAHIQEAILSAVPVPVLIVEMLDGLTALLASAQGAPVPPQGSVSSEWVTTYAGGIPLSNIVKGISILWDMQGRTRASDTAAATTLAAGYTLFVDALSPAGYIPTPPPLPAIAPAVQASPARPTPAEPVDEAPLSQDDLKALILDRLPGSCTEQPQPEGPSTT